MKKLLKFVAYVIGVPFGLLFLLALLRGALSLTEDKSPEYLARYTRAKNLSEAVCRTSVGIGPSVEMVTAFIDQGGDVNQQVANYSGSFIPLIAQAAECNHTDIVRLLIQRGARVDKAVLRYVVISCNEAMVRMLIDEAAAQAPQVPPDGPEFGPELLQSAVVGGQTWLVQRLLDKGADIHMVNARGDSLLVLALKGRYSGSVETVKLLLAAGANPNPVGDTDDPALIWAVHWHRVEEAELLLEAGAKVDPPVPMPWFEKAGIHTRLPGTTALLLAVKNCDLEIVESLVRHGASKSAVVRYYNIAATKNTCSLHPPEQVEKMLALLGE